MSDNGQQDGVPVPQNYDPDHLFKHLPEIIREKGRALGFENARDLIFSEWFRLRTIMPGYSALKLAIEFDRHAMFAEVASERLRGRYDEGLWSQYQRYLTGEIDIAPSAAGGVHSSHGSQPRMLAGSIPSEEEDDGGSEISETVREVTEGPGEFGSNEHPDRQDSRGAE